MTSLIACLGTGKGTWSQVIELIAKEEWDQIFLITNKFGKEQFLIQKDNINFIIIDETKPLINLVSDLNQQLKGKISGFEVAVNIISGTGNEHMAIISSVLKLGLAMRLVTAGKEGIEEI
jgi:hypothetical protein